MVITAMSEFRERLNTRYVQEIKDQIEYESGPIYEYVKAKSAADFMCARVTKDHYIFKPMISLGDCVNSRLQEELKRAEKIVFDHKLEESVRSQL